MAKATRNGIRESTAAAEPDGIAIINASNSDCSPLKSTVKLPFD
jgi:hypothetical protein